MTDPSPSIRPLIESLLQRWEREGLPSHQTLKETADRLVREGRQQGLSGLWTAPPLMITATLDDGIGQGIDLIHRYARAAGMQVRFLGRMPSKEMIVAECTLQRPRLLGVTLLQVDSEEMLRWIGEQIPDRTLLIGGGAAFSTDDELAARCGVDFVAGDVSGFLRFLLEDFSP